MTYRRYESDADRITLNVTVTEAGCWEWQQCLDNNGYSRLMVAKKLRYGHRFSYEQFVGPIPDGMELDHLCRVRHCVNPEHLEPVTPLENNRRSPITNGKKTACPQGHAYNDENTHRDRKGRRVCRICRATAVRRWYRRKQAQRAAGIQAA